jgi:OmpA-OmpF porin, OOP family
MKKLISFLLFAFVTTSGLFSQDAEGSKDPTLFTRMPNYFIDNYEDIEFNKFDFIVGANKMQAIEGHYLKISYSPKEGTQEASGLQIIKNYSNAVRSIGGTVVYENTTGYGEATLKVIKNGKEAWAKIEPGIGGYTIVVVEKEAMQQDVVADASSMLNSIEQTGKVALYGIYFDTGKSTLKTESKQALTEISNLMKKDPALKLYVVGHTDNTGTYEANIKLSMDRANAVVNALISQYSATAANLKACGAGPIAPVASNETEAGKALNRRVELVKQ